MKKLCILGGWILTLLLSGCLPNQRFMTHELALEQVQRNDTELHTSEFGDLRGDGEDYYLGSDAQPSNPQSVYVFNQAGKVLSQINIGQKVRGIKVLAEPEGNRQWAFISYNDQRSTTILGVSYIWKTPLQREEKQFESIPRTDERMGDPKYEWYGIVYPVLLRDIDGDGRLELVCKAMDGYTVNPRGLVVYDFESGGIKWRFDLSTSLSTVLLEDFDGDGSMEFVCANYAFKNSSESVLGMDDANGWLMVINTQGELVYSEKAFDGYGEIFLASDDADGDGKKEIYATYTTWGTLNIPNSVNKLSWNGRRLKREKQWSVTGNFERAYSKGIYHTMDKANTKRVLVVEKGEGLRVLDGELDLVEHNYDEFVRDICDVGDLDLDGYQEILLYTADDRFVILDHNFVKRAEIRNPFPEDTSTWAEIVESGYGKAPKVAVVSGKQLHYYGYAPEPFWVIAYRLVKTHALFISICLFFTVLALIIHAVRRRRMVYLAFNSLRQGSIVMANSNRIAYYNDYLTHLVQSDLSAGKSTRLKYLRDCLPNLYNALNNFRHGDLDRYSQNMNLGERQLEHKVNFFKLKGLRRRYLITLIPNLDNPASLEDKLAWAEIARRLAHNVRRHITNVILALAPLQEPDQLDTTREYAGLIRDEVEKIRVFTHAFQRFTELKDYELKPQDIIPSVEHCLAHIVIPDRVQVIRNWQLKSISTLIEPIRFEEALSNLINNSLEAMPEGGTLHLTVKEFPHHSSPQGELRVLVEIEDSGRGIPQKYQEEIFKPFFTTNPSGTGIGLPEARKIIESMGGTISVQSVEGEGTVVSIWLKGEESG